MSENKPPESGSVPAPIPVSLSHSKTLEEVIQEKAPEVLKDISKPKRQVLAQVTIEERRISMRSSPLPDPAELVAYNQVIPNGAERIFKVFENQSAHRLKIETTVVEAQQKQAFFGQICALIIALFGLSVGGYVAINGQPVAGAAIGGTTLGGLVSAFIYNKHSQKRELFQKHPETPQGQQSRGQKKKNRKR